MAKRTIRRSITMTQEMRDRLAQLVSKQQRDKPREAAMNNVTEHAGGAQFTPVATMRQNYQQRKQQIEMEA